MDSSVYVFVKGDKGRFAYEIVDSEFKRLQEQVTDLPDNTAKVPDPWETDLLAAIASLQFIIDNPNNVPKNPTIFMFTTFESNYHLLANCKKPDLKKVEKIISKIRSLADKISAAGTHESDFTVNFYWIPNGFKNRMNHLDDLLDSSSE